MAIRGNTKWIEVSEYGLGFGLSRVYQLISHRGNNTDKNNFCIPQMSDLSYTTDDCFGGPKQPAHQCISTSDVENQKFYL